VRGLPDRALFAIITHGIPRAGMPAFGLLLEPDEIRAVVGYIRRAGGTGATPQVPGDPARGEALFFGKARCGDCHMVKGKGGFLGADLSGYGRDHSPAQILGAILHPGAGPVRETVTAITRNGQQWTGVARNEDNFSIQLLDANGVFHLIMKSDLRSLKREPRSLMPGDCGTRLSSIELDDLVGYLARSAAARSTRTP
jgi:cytochrome c oxidase cbb3-type subunit 3